MTAELYEGTQGVYDNEDSVAVLKILNYLRLMINEDDWRKRSALTMTKTKTKCPNEDGCYFLIVFIKPVIWRSIEIVF